MFENVLVLLLFMVLKASCSIIVDEQICGEISSFIPNVCRHNAFRTKCPRNCPQVHHKLSSCGTRSTYRPRKRRIIGSVESDIGQWPWHVSLQLNGNHTCGASILSPHYIITAAHCLDAQYTSGNPVNFTVLAGTNQHSAPGKRLRVHSFKNHPSYTLTKHCRKEFYFVYVKNDIGVIRLKDKLDLNTGNRGSVCLPDVSNPIPSNYQCYIVGYGLTIYNNITSSNALKYAPLNLRHSPIATVPIEECNRPKAFNNTVSNKTTICAGDGSPNVSPCNLDSGGGLVCEKNGTWFLRGITSSGYRCGDNDSYAMFTNVANYEDWIIKTIFDLQDSTNAARDSHPTISLALTLLTFYLICINQLH